MDEKNLGQEMRQILERQRASYRLEGPVAASTRIDRIQRAIDLLVDHELELCDALAADFGYRPRTPSRMADIVPSIRALKFARANVERWMEDEERPLSEPYKGLGARGYVQYQPKGVVGNIVPWNAPVNIAFSSLAGMLAAGNRVMIKPSEDAPATAELLRDVIGQYFYQTEIAVCPGAIETGREFARLPFDHLLFTGSTSVGRTILAAAAENLVPVTLELGGKSPAIIGRSADISQAVERIVLGKHINAGQVCLSPDYVLVQESMLNAVVDGITRIAQKCYPAVHENPDYVAIINAKHRSRLDDLVDDARSKGAVIIEVNGEGPPFSSIKRPLTLILNSNDQMKVSREEIFGPLLPIVTYNEIDEAVSYVSARPKPLGLYYFGKDAAEEAYVLGNTISGGVTVNDVIAHVAHEELPFGGVGASGMGVYHGFDGFKTFSHARTVYRQTDIDLAGMIGARPPLGAPMEKVLTKAITK